MGGSASRTSGNSGTTDPGGGECAALATRNRPVWVSPVGYAHGSAFFSQSTGFPTIGESSAGVFTKGTRAGHRKTHVLPCRTWHRRIGLLEIILLKWVGVCRRCSLLCPELSELGGRCGRLGEITGPRRN